MLLHYLLPPTFSSGSWKPSFIDSQKSFLTYDKHKSLDDLIELRERVCLNRKIKSHPYVVGFGPSILEMQHFYVVISNCKMKAESFLAAINLCMQYFILFDIPYPPESKAVWVLINKLFYNIKIDHLLTSRVVKLLHDLK